MFDKVIRKSRVYKELMDRYSKLEEEYEYTLDLVESEKEQKRQYQGHAVEEMAENNRLSEAIACMLNETVGVGDDVNGRYVVIRRNQLDKYDGIHISFSHDMFPMDALKIYAEKKNERGTEQKD